VCCPLGFIVSGGLDFSGSGGLGSFLLGYTGSSCVFKLYSGSSFFLFLLAEISNVGAGLITYHGTSSGTVFLGHLSKVAII